jgi:hypothetical protein
MTPEDRFRTYRSAVCRFGQNEAIASLARRVARSSALSRSRCSGRPIDLEFNHPDESSDRVYGGAIISRWRRDALTGVNRAMPINCRRLDLSAAEIDADAETCCHRRCIFIEARQEGGYGLLSSMP